MDLTVVIVGAGFYSHMHDFDMESIWYDFLKFIEFSHYHISCSRDGNFLTHMECHLPKLNFSNQKWRDKDE